VGGAGGEGDEDLEERGGDGDGAILHSIILAHTILTVNIYLPVVRG
jgi:hypothetical protein